MFSPSAKILINKECESNSGERSALASQVDVITGVLGLDLVLFLSALERYCVIYLVPERLCDKDVTVMNCSHDDCVQKLKGCQG